MRIHVNRPTFKQPYNCTMVSCRNSRSSPTSFCRSALSSSLTSTLLIAISMFVALWVAWYTFPYAPDPSFASRVNASFGFSISHVRSLVMCIFCRNCVGVLMAKFVLLAFFVGFFGFLLLTFAKLILSELWATLRSSPFRFSHGGSEFNLLCETSKLLRPGRSLSWIGIVVNLLNDMFRVWSDFSCPNDAGRAQRRFFWMYISSRARSFGSSLGRAINLFPDKSRNLIFCFPCRACIMRVRSVAGDWSALPDRPSLNKVVFTARAEARSDTSLDGINVPCIRSFLSFGVFRNRW
mmetsp:Transcript_19256/g.54048  ORF Transcript_19256/g.54048 Transcript_19256/m.54048 type:complete len:294 (-) Transcript_19256:1288-2169(-)